VVTQTENRLNDSHNLAECAALLTDGVYAVVKLMGTLLQGLDAQQAGELVVIMDLKRLYGIRILELFRMCNSDIERFRYHVYVELPNQETGEVDVVYALPYFTVDPTTKEGQAFFERRQFGRPNEFWGLVHPPTQMEYRYPII
jgi:hypothetical protein